MMLLCTAPKSLCAICLKVGVRPLPQSRCAPSASKSLCALCLEVAVRHLSQSRCVPSASKSLCALCLKATMRHLPQIMLIGVCLWPVILTHGSRVTYDHVVCLPRNSGGLAGQGARQPLAVCLPSPRGHLLEGWYSRGGGAIGRVVQPACCLHKQRLWRRQTPANAESLRPRQCLMRVCARQGPCLLSGGCFL